MSYIVWGIAVLILDIMTKLLAELQLRAVDTIPLLRDIFHLTYVENTGIAFGLFSGARWIFVAVTIGVLGLLAVIFTYTHPRSRWLKWGMSLVYGGALGNLLERMAKGYVVDFLDFRLIHFPVFNVADIAVCAGAVCLMIHFIFYDKPKEGENGA